MPKHYIFADEAGDLTFQRGQNISRYFILCTIHLESCKVGHDLLELRRDLIWRDLPLGEYFHASHDKQIVRDAVFGLIQREDFQVQATVMEKSKGQAHIRQSKERFYQYGWFYHAKHAISRMVRADAEFLVTTASVGTKKGQAIFTAGVNDVFQQTIPRDRWKTFFCPSAADPCLQLADYCTWAIQKKWERGDSRSYNLIANKVTYEYDLWQRGLTHYY